MVTMEYHRDHATRTPERKQMWNAEWGMGGKDSNDGSLSFHIPHSTFVL
jgi:hypothetical protein